VTDSEEVHRHLISLRAHGSTKKYFSEEQGYNSRLDEIQAAILRVKLKCLDTWSANRRAAADRYDALLADVPEVITPERRPEGTHVFHQYTVRVQERDRVQKRLAENGITTMVYYPVPIHLQPIYRSLGYKAGRLAVTEAACGEALSLPMFPELTPDQSKYVADVLEQAVRA